MLSPGVCPLAIHRLSQFFSDASDVACGGHIYLLVICLHLLFCRLIWFIWFINMLNEQMYNKCTNECTTFFNFPYEDAFTVVVLNFIFSIHVVLL